jgi:hypothetical protein
MTTRPRVFDPGSFSDPGSFYYLAATLLKSIAHCVLSKRPGRVELRPKKAKTEAITASGRAAPGSAQILAQRALKVVP